MQVETTGELIFAMRSVEMAWISASTTVMMGTSLMAMDVMLAALLNSDINVSEEHLQTQILAQKSVEMVLTCSITHAMTAIW